jgi:glucose-6-phosphate isomerase
MNFDEAFLDRMRKPMADALDAMNNLEAGAEANIDEDRMVGHYWLRAPELAPNDSIRTGIEQCIADVKQFAYDVHSGTIKPQQAETFDVVLVIGIGGSALGPQFAADALGGPDDLLLVRFIDNTDPDGIERTLAELDDAIGQTLTIVSSKSGTTIETRNAMIEVATRYKQAGLDFAKHAVAITCERSALHQQATREGWLRSFPMWDWVGGRTSVTSAVGILPAALQGIDIDDFLAGARDADTATREQNMPANPAALLALMWHYAGNGRGDRNMVVLPYRDRLQLFSRFLQQLVMESIGKEKDRAGNVVHQGLTVFGNKGTNDQHSYVQQLIDGRNDFFVTFITVHKDGVTNAIEVEDGITSGDYLHAFWLGTRNALYDAGRQSVTITLDELTPHRAGALIALFERAVGLYAELINVNAYNQPGVDAGKKAASETLELQRKVQGYLDAAPETPSSPDDVAAALNEPDSVEQVHNVLSRLQSAR